MQQKHSPTMQSFVDLLIVATLRASGHNPVGVYCWNNGKVHWQFTFDKAEIADTLNKFYSGQLLVNAATLKNEFERTKSEVTVAAKAAIKRSQYEYAAGQSVGQR